MNLFDWLITMPPWYQIVFIPCMAMLLAFLSRGALKTVLTRIKKLKVGKSEVTTNQSRRASDKK